MKIEPQKLSSARKSHLKINLRGTSSALVLCVMLSSLSALWQPACVQPPSGIIAWWPLDETTGTTSADVVGNNPGIHVNGPEAATGQVDGALQFHGTGDYVGAPDSDLWAFGANNFTIELWANFDGPIGGSVGHPGAIFVGNDEGPGSVNKWFFALGGGFLNFHINSPTIGAKFFPLVPVLHKKRNAVRAVVMQTNNEI